MDFTKLTDNFKLINNVLIIFFEHSCENNQTCIKKIFMVETGHKHNCDPIDSFINILPKKEIIHINSIKTIKIQLNDKLYTFTLESYFFMIMNNVLILKTFDENMILFFPCIYSSLL